MAAKSTLKNMVLCLSAVCLVCSALLAVTYAVTLDPIAAAQQAKTNASIAKVLPAFEGDAQPATVELDGTEYQYYTAEGAGCAVIVSTSGFGGPLTLMVGIAEDGKVHNTAVLSHSETPGLGAKCQTDEHFISQFRGWDPAAKSLVVKKDGGDVDAITASTITSRAYTLAVATAVKVFEAINPAVEELPAEEENIAIEEGGQENE